MTFSDDQFMDLALRLARRGLGQTWPNPAVGAVIVDPESQTVLGRGWTQPGGRPHAEAVALEDAGQRVKGATLYVTLEPCAHHGKTPPCTKAIIESDLKHVVVALDDPDPRVAGQGLAELRKAGIEVSHASQRLRAKAHWLNYGHLLRIKQGRPFVQLKLAVGADGLIAPGTGSPVWVTGEAARARVHLLRAQVDGILVGRGTVEADDPSLTCRLPGMTDRSPVRIVLDSHLSMSPKAKLVTTAEASVPTWIICGLAVPEERFAPFLQAGAEIIRVQEDPQTGLISLKAALTSLAERGMTRIMVEGGPHVAQSFLDADLVDEVVIFHGSKKVGADGLKPFGNEGLERLSHAGPLKFVNEEPIGSDLMQIYRRVLS